jgi:hypothetical protein
MTGISGVAWQQQEDLFGDSGPRPGAEPVLMALHAEYYELIWRGLKTREFRRRFLQGRPARWFAYQQIATIAERRLYAPRRRPGAECRSDARYRRMRASRLSSNAASTGGSPVWVSQQGGLSRPA